MFIFVLSSSIPPQYKISLLKNILLCLFSKYDLTFLWWIISFWSYFSLFCWTSMIWKTLLWMSLGSSNSSCINLRTGKPNWVGKTTFVPYTIWKGEVPMDFLVLIRSAHSENLNFESHDRLFSVSNFLIILMRVLLDDYANPMPWG